MCKETVDFPHRNEPDAPNLDILYCLDDSAIFAYSDDGESELNQ